MLQDYRRMLLGTLVSHVKKSLEVRYKIVYSPMISHDFNTENDSFMIADEMMNKLTDKFVNASLFLLLFRPIFRMTVNVDVKAIEFLKKSGGSYPVRMVPNFSVSEIVVNVSVSSNERFTISLTNKNIEEIRAFTNHGKISNFDTFIGAILFMFELDNHMIVSNKGMFEILNKMIGNKVLYDIQDSINSSVKHIEAHKAEIIERAKKTLQNLAKANFLGKLQDVINQTPDIPGIYDEITKRAAFLLAEKINES